MESLKYPNKLHQYQKLKIKNVYIDIMVAKYLHLLFFVSQNKIEILPTNELEEI